MRGKGEPLLKKGLPLPPHPHPALQNVSSEKMAGHSRAATYPLCRDVPRTVPASFPKSTATLRSALSLFRSNRKTERPLHGRDNAKSRKEYVTLPENPRHARRGVSMRGKPCARALARAEKVRHRERRLPERFRQNPKTSTCYQDGSAVFKEKP